MGTQRQVVIGESPEDLGSPIAEHHGKKKEKEHASGHKNKVEEKIKAAKFKKEAVGEVEVAEKTAESEAPQETDKETSEKPKKVKQGKAKVRGQKYQKVNALIDHNKKYPIAEALELIKQVSISKFDGNVEAHIRLLSKTGKPESARGMMTYPHSTGKKNVVVILDEKIIEEILKNGKTDFDIALATPEMMPKVAKLAKILGPKGKMPNPKTGTVTADPIKTKKELEGGLLEYKTDNYGIIHQVLGKVSTDSKNLAENYHMLLSHLLKDKLASVYLCPTIGPSVKVSLAKQT